MDFEKLDELAFRFAGKRKSHIEREIGASYFHGKRTSLGVIELRKLIVQDDDTHDDALRCAGLFHDCAKGLEPHPRTAVLLLREYAKELLTPEELDEVCELIAVHDQRMKENDYTVWQKLLQDADLLDHYGVQGTWMSFAYQCFVGQQSPLALIEFYDGEWQEQIARCLSLLNFEESKQIFHEKCDFEYSVIERLKHEGTGYYCL